MFELVHIDVVKVCINKIFIFTLPPHLSISLQPGDRMEEQLPSSERAGQGEQLNDTFTLLLNRDSTKTNDLCQDKSKSS